MESKLENHSIYVITTLMTLYMGFPFTEMSIDDKVVFSGNNLNFKFRDIEIRVWYISKNMCLLILGMLLWVIEVN